MTNIMKRFRSLLSCIGGRDRRQLITPPEERIDIHKCRQTETEDRKERSKDRGKLCLGGSSFESQSHENDSPHKPVNQTYSTENRHSLVKVSQESKSVEPIPSSGIALDSVDVKNDVPSQLAIADSSQVRSPNTGTNDDSPQKATLVENKQEHNTTTAVEENRDMDTTTVEHFDLDSSFDSLKDHEYTHIESIRDRDSTTYHAYTLINTTENTLPKAVPPSTNLGPERQVGGHEIHISAPQNNLSSIKIRRAVLSRSSFSSAVTKSSYNTVKGLQNYCNTADVCFSEEFDSEGPISPDFLDPCTVNLHYHQEEIKQEIAKTTSSDDIKERNRHQPTEVINSEPASAALPDFKYLGVSSSESSIESSKQQPLKNINELSLGDDILDKKETTVDQEETEPKQPYSEDYVVVGQTLKVPPLQITNKITDLFQDRRVGVITCGADGGNYTLFEEFDSSVMHVSVPAGALENKTDLLLMKSSNLSDMPTNVQPNKIKSSVIICHPHAISFQEAILICFPINTQSYENLLIMYNNQEWGKRANWKTMENSDQAEHSFHFANERCYLFASHFCSYVVFEFNPTLQLPLLGAFLKVLPTTNQGIQIEVGIISTKENGKKVRTEYDAREWKTLVANPEKGKVFVKLREGKNLEVSEVDNFTKELSVYQLEREISVSEDDKDTRPPTLEFFATVKANLPRDSWIDLATEVYQNGADKVELRFRKNYQEVFPTLPAAPNAGHLQDIDWSRTPSATQTESSNEDNTNVSSDSDAAKLPTAIGGYDISEGEKISNLDNFDSRRKKTMPQYPNYVIPKLSEKSPEGPANSLANLIPHMHNVRYTHVRKQIPADILNEISKQIELAGSGESSCVPIARKLGFNDFVINYKSGFLKYKNPFKCLIQMYQVKSQGNWTQFHEVLMDSDCTTAATILNEWMNDSTS